MSHFSYNKKTRQNVIDKSIKNFTMYIEQQLANMRKGARDADQFWQRHILLPRLYHLEREGKPTDALHAHITNELDKFDVVGIFENYTASMLLIARATGLPLSRYSAPSVIKNQNIKVHRDFVSQIWSNELGSDAQRAFFRQHMELDYWLYEESMRRFNAQVLAGGKELAAQLQEMLTVDPEKLYKSLSAVCNTSECMPGMSKEQSTNRFVWKDQQCWPPGERELAACGKEPHLKPNFDPALCG